jgi:hypothetical protein
LRQHKGRVAQPEEGFDHIAAGGEEEGPQEDQKETGPAGRREWRFSAIRAFEADLF